MKNSKIKRIAASILSAAMLITPCVFGASAEEAEHEAEHYDVIWGDIDFDSFVTISDATAIQQLLAEVNIKTVLDSVNDETLLDIDKDGSFTVSDATELQKYMAEFKTANDKLNTVAFEWHEAEFYTVEHPAETEQVKVVDCEAYTYEEPVYETRWIAKCKDCGIDISKLENQEARNAHAESHVLEGGDGGWYSTTEQVQVGTETVYVPEQSHMETVVVKEAWTERIVTKEAGWY